VAWGGGQNERGDYGVRGALGDEDRRGWVEESLDSDDDEQVQVTKELLPVMQSKLGEMEVDAPWAAGMLALSKLWSSTTGWPLMSHRISLPDPSRLVIRRSQAPNLSSCFRPK
jgi:hypothetical protein